MIRTEELVVRQSCERYGRRRAQAFPFNNSLAPCRSQVASTTLAVVSVTVETGCPSRSRHAQRANVPKLAPIYKGFGVRVPSLPAQRAEPEKSATTSGRPSPS